MKNLENGSSHKSQDYLTLGYRKLILKQSRGYSSQSVVSSTRT